MILTDKQEQGLKIAVKRFKDRERYTCISGYAGTGKSTLVRFIIEALNLNPKTDVCYISYTGKAASVLQEKGCPNAITAHKLLYNSYRKKDGTYSHYPKRPLDGSYKLIVVDEISMLPEKMWRLLLSHRIHVIALGDPEQLPSIGDGNNVLKNPHIFLDEIMRQAQESEIIRLTMDIRDGKSLPYFKGNEVQILPKSKVSDGMLTWADQIICAKNETRTRLNNQMRKTLFNTDERIPIIGDKIICLRNSWEVLNPDKDPLVNGLIGTVEDISIDYTNPFIEKVLLCDFLPDHKKNSMGLFTNVKMDYSLFATGQPSITKENFKKIPSTDYPIEFDFGYAITCWKAQGSEFNKVLLFEENYPSELNFHRRYLYTGATRAIDKLVIIRKD